MSIYKPKLVLSGSASLQSRIAYWKAHFEAKGYDVIAYPEAWDDAKNFTEQLIELYTDFYRAIDECDVFFLMNEDRNEIDGYIGANGTAELIHTVTLNLIHGKNIKIYIAKVPSDKVLAYDEVTSFLRAGWIRLYDPTAL